MTSYLNLLCLDTAQNATKMAGLAEFEPSWALTGLKESFELVEPPEPLVLDTWDLETHEIHETHVASNYSVSRLCLPVSADFVEQTSGPWH